jgi:hypothetical protein
MKRPITGGLQLKMTTQRGSSSLRGWTALLDVSEVQEKPVDVMQT